MNGMEPAFGEAYGGHRGLLSPYPLAMSPQGGRTEHDQVRRRTTELSQHYLVGVVLLGRFSSPRKMINGVQHSFISLFTCVTRQSSCLDEKTGL